MNERTSNIRQLAIMAVVAVIVAFAVPACFSLTPRRYPALDSRLGASAWQATNLLVVLSWEYRDDGQNPLGLGFPDFFDFQHLALLRLLDIQRSQFGHSAPRRATGGDFIDHSYVHIIERTKSRVVVIATGTLKPVHFDRSGVDGPAPYWQMERFTFASSGQLLSRESFTE
jgi:hypothetical protein